MAESQSSTNPILGEVDLLRIANDLPNEKWTQLGKNLDLSETDLKNIVTNQQLQTPVEKCYQMLVLWRSRAEMMWEKLAEALCSDEVGCPHLAGKYQTSKANPESAKVSHQLKLSGSDDHQSSSFEEDPHEDTSQHDKQVDQLMKDAELKVPTLVTDTDQDTDKSNILPKSPESPPHEQAAANDLSIAEEETDGETKNRRQHISEDEPQVGQPSLSVPSPNAHDADPQMMPRSESNNPPPLQHSSENQSTGEQDTEPQQQDNPILDLWRFTAYTWVHRFCSHTTLVAIVLTTLMCAQIFLVSVDCYESYNIRSEHSQCSCSFPYPWLVTAALRITSRFAFPLLLSIVFWRQVVCRKAAALEGQAGSTKESFADLIQKKPNHEIVKELVRKFWNKSVKPTDDAIVLLTRIRDELNHELTLMCFTSLVQPFVLIIAFFAFNLVDAHSGLWQGSSFWLGVADTVSFGIITAVSGVMLSFYFLESKIKRYVRAVHTLPKKLSKLHEKAKDTEHCITDRWYHLEIGMRFASVIVPTILLMNWTSDIPLSCGFSVSIEAITNQSAAACWMGFIVVVTFGQVMVTSPFYPLYLRCTGLIVEVALLSLFYLTFPTNEWMQLTHVLYAIVPLSYLIWYHIASIRRQWLAINKTTEGNPTYVSRLASRTGLFILIMATLAASLYVEYGHLHPSAIGKYSRADNIAQLPDVTGSIIDISGMKHVRADHEKALLQQLAQKYNAMLYFVEENLQSNRDVYYSPLGQEHCSRKL